MRPGRNKVSMLYFRIQRYKMTNKKMLRLIGSVDSNDLPNHLSIFMGKSFGVPIQMDSIEALSQRECFCAIKKIQQFIKNKLTVPPGDYDFCGTYFRIPISYSNVSVEPMNTDGFFEPIGENYPLYPDNSRKPKLNYFQR